MIHRPAIRVFLAAAAVVVSCSTSALAQVDPAAIIEKQSQQSRQLAEEWLASPDPRVRAWGAYLVLRDRHTDLAPALLSLVRSYEPFPEPDKDQHDALLPVLDSLIELGISAPAEDAAKMFPEFPAQSLVLLSRVPDGASQELLKIFGTIDDSQVTWLAAGNLLAEKRVPGFAAVVLSRMTVKATITITDPQPAEGEGYGHGTGCTAGMLHGSFDKPGWPAVGNYSLELSDNSGTKLFASGADPVYYSRDFSVYYPAERHGYRQSPGDPNLIRQHFLSTLLRASQFEPPIEAEIYHDIPWSSDFSYLDEVQSFVLNQQERIATATQRLVSADLLALEEESTSRPSFQIIIADRRQQPHPALPALPPLDSVPSKVTVVLAQ